MPTTSLPTLSEGTTLLSSQEWFPLTENGTDFQFQLPDDLLLDWPFDIGQGDAFDFLRSDWNGVNIGLFDGPSIGLTDQIGYGGTGL